MKKHKSLILFIAAIIIINILAANYFFRVDLTEDKRYSLSDATKSLLKGLEEPVYIEILLSGEDIGPDFSLMQKSLTDKLEEFSRYTKTDINYYFNDPNLLPDTVRNRYMQGYFKVGIKPKMMVDVENGTLSKRTVLYPGLVIKYKNNIEGINLFKWNDVPRNKRQRKELVNKSIENIEYELAFALRKLTVQQKKSIAFLSGHGELTEQETFTIRKKLSEVYEVKNVQLTEYTDLSKHDLVVMAKPRIPFGEKEKFVLDQYLVNGGNALFLYDAVSELPDSTNEQYSYLAPLDLNMRDFFFRLGVRFNDDLIKDVQCVKIDEANWYFYPFLFNFNPSSPVVRNSDAISAKFISTIDTTKAVGIKKTPLVFSSKVSRRVKAPVVIDMGVGKPIKEEQFQEGSFPVGYLLEGKFVSNYQYRPSPIRGKKVVEKNKNARVVLLGDGDIIKDMIDPKTKKQLPLGYEVYSKRMFGNADFLQNIVEYLVEGNTLIAAKAAERIVRPLDTQKVSKEKAFWQVLNIVVPIILVALFGLGKFFMRKRKYALKNRSI